MDAVKSQADQSRTLIAAPPNRTADLRDRDTVHYLVSHLPAPAPQTPLPVGQ